MMASILTGVCCALDAKAIQERRPALTIRRLSMTIRNNGSRRDPRRILSALFMFAVALLCLYFTFHNGFKWAWLIISLALFYLSFAMFRSANEV